jgi:hypothetical protein
MIKLCKTSGPTRPIDVEVTDGPVNPTVTDGPVNPI